MFRDDEATVDDHDGRRANDDDDDDEPLLTSWSLLGGRFCCERMCLSIICRCVTIPTIIILHFPRSFLAASVVTFSYCCSRDPTPLQVLLRALINIASRTTTTAHSGGQHDFEFLQPSGKCDASQLSGTHLAYSGDSSLCRVIYVFLAVNNMTYYCGFFGEEVHRNNRDFLYVPCVPDKRHLGCG
jgi:hypothetical protein